MRGYCDGGGKVQICMLDIGSSHRKTRSVTPYRSLDGVVPLVRYAGQEIASCNRTSRESCSVKYIHSRAGQACSRAAWKRRRPHIGSIEDLSDAGCDLSVLARRAGTTSRRGRLRIAHVCSHAEECEIASFLHIYPFPPASYTSTTCPCFLHLLTPLYTP
eukprot:6204365-Pleurochrysis_carterae.AAC.2